MTTGRRFSLAHGAEGKTQLKAGMVFRDVESAWCPELVVVPRGMFVMGSTERERQWAWEQGAEEEVPDERPQRRVTVPEPFAAGRHATTRGQFAAFVEATGHDMSGDCWVYPFGGGWQQSVTANWRSPGFEQSDQHPVVGVSWQDAKAYVQWLGKETGQPFRLLSEAEWEYACRAGTTTYYWWGDDLETYEAANCGNFVHGTAEVGTYPSNSWGLYEMHGNVAEWCEDCRNHDYANAPKDSAAWVSGDCRFRAVRGGSFMDSPVFLRSAACDWEEASSRSFDIGFRVARALGSGSGDVHATR